jgi:uncharacterized protein (DUF2344 family)|tara:strand:- start:517 stop:780 length:264 start_codon:yes stop_codon:yes gene_type:complete
LIIGIFHESNTFDNHDIGCKSGRNSRMKKNWVYYMQEGLKSMWSKKPKTNKKYAIDLSDRRREEKIKKIFESIDDAGVDIKTGKYVG